MVYKKRQRVKKVLKNNKFDSIKSIGFLNCLKGLENALKIEVVSVDYPSGDVLIYLNLLTDKVYDVLQNIAKTYNYEFLSVERCKHFNTNRDVCSITYKKKDSNSIQEGYVLVNIDTNKAVCTWIKGGYSRISNSLVFSDASITGYGELYSTKERAMNERDIVNNNFKRDILVVRKAKLIIYNDEKEVL